MEPPSGLVGKLWKAFCAFQAAVGIRVLSRFPSAASVSTRPPFLSFLLLFSFFLPIPSFSQKNFAPAAPESDDSQPGRPTASPCLLPPHAVSYTHLDVYKRQQQSLSTYTRPHVLVIDEIGYLTRIIREVITNDSQWCKVGYESQ